MAPVAVAPIFFFLDMGPLYLFSGEKVLNAAIGQGTGAITYISSNTAVATVQSSTGLVTVVGSGSATIIAVKAADNNFLSASASYTIYSARSAQDFSFAQPGEINLLAGATFSNPATGQGSGAISYQSSDPSIATVDNKGVVTVKSVGRVQINASIEGDNYYIGAIKTYSINATGNPQSLSFSHPGSVAVTVGTNLANPAAGLGSKPILYATSNKDIATVDGNGNITVTGPGTATITATTEADHLYLAGSAQFTVYSQAIRFATTGDFTQVVGDTVVNPATAQGSGLITYTSSDTSVATVDGSGKVTLVNNGSAFITASVASDGAYVAASAKYGINASLAVTAWVGSTDTLVNFPALLSGFEFSRSSDKDCDLNQYLSCANGQMDLLTGSTITDTITRRGSPGYYLVKKDAKQATLTLKVDTNDQANGIYTHVKSSSIYHTLVFKNKIWTIGTYTYDYSAHFFNDIWSSSDGINWTREVANTPFVYRDNANILLYNNKLWLIGGISRDGVVRNDVWSSEDGLHWVEETKDANIRLTFRALVAYNNKLWAIGGDDDVSQSIKNDIWSSPDGITWTLENAAAVFPARSGHKVVSFNNQLWLIGGRAAPFYNDVWSSQDGITWVQQTANAGFEPRRDASVAVYSNKLWLIGGTGNPYPINDIWSSADGVHWTQITTALPFSARARHGLVDFNNHLMLLGGNTQNPKVNYYANDTWITTDGIDWRVGYRGNFIFSQ